MSQTPAELLANTEAQELPVVAALLLLSELAYSDGDFDARERATILESLTSIFAMDPERILSLLNEMDESRKGPPDLTGLNRLLKQRLPDLRDRKAVVKAMWDVIFADSHVASIEDRLASSMAMLLGVDFSAVAELKAECRAHQ